VSTPAASPGTPLQQLAAALAGFSLDQADAAVAAAARQRLFDTVGAACVGLETAEGRLLRALDGEARPLAPTRHALDRCRLFVGAARATEIDDIDVASCTTVGSVVVPAALAIAASEPRADDRTLLAGIVVGYEAMVRLGRALRGATLLYRGVWPTYVTAAFGAAATTAKLLGLDAAQTARALALALARTSTPSSAALARFGFRYFALGATAADGCAAALAARAGVDADPAEIEAFGKRVGADFDAAELTESGGRWRIGEVDTKMFPSSRQALASVEAFLEAASGRPWDEIERVVIAVPAAYRDMIDRPSLPTRRIESLLGVQYQIALAALAPDALYDALRTTLRADDGTAALIARCEVRADADLDARFPRVWGSRVTVRWRPGGEAAAEVLEPRGSGRRELGWPELRAKLDRILAASGLERPGLVSQLHARCESAGVGSASAQGGCAAPLLERLEALAARTAPPPSSERMRVQQAAP